MSLSELSDPHLKDFGVSLILSPKLSFKIKYFYHKSLPITYRISLKLDVCSFNSRDLPDWVKHGSLSWGKGEFLLV